MQTTKPITMRGEQAGTAVQLRNGLVATPWKIHGTRIYVVRRDSKLVGYYMAHGNAGWSVKLISDETADPRSAIGTPVFQFGSLDENHPDKEHAIAMLTLAVDADKAWWQVYHEASARVHTISRIGGMIKTATYSIDAIADSNDRRAVLNRLRQLNEKAATPCIELLKILKQDCAKLTRELERLQEVHDQDMARFAKVLAAELAAK